MSFCEPPSTCSALLFKAGLLPTGVTAKVYKNGSLKLEGDLSKVKGGNALRLLQFVKSDKSMTSADIRRKDLVACDHPTSEMGLLRLANAQVRSLRADNPAADTCLRTNSSSSLRWEYGASTQFACVFPVIRREILCSASRSKKRMVFLAVAPRR